MLADAGRGRVSPGLEVHPGCGAGPEQLENIRCSIMQFNSLDDITAIFEEKCFTDDYINCNKTQEAKSELKTKDDLSIKPVGGG